VREQGWRGVSVSIVRGVVAALRRSEVSVVMSVMAARARSGSVAWRRGSKSRNAGAIFGGRLTGVDANVVQIPMMYLCVGETWEWQTAT
jgi:hypothetical protein